MKIASIVTGQAHRLAIQTRAGDLFVPSLSHLSEHQALPLGLRQALGMADGVAALAQALADFENNRSDYAAATVAMDDAHFGPPIPDPVHFMGCGASYHQHLAEMGGVPVPENPVIFLCSSRSLAGHGSIIIPPPGQSDMIDYEGELAFVIGRECYNVEETDALDYVAGYIVHNDISARNHVAEVQAVEVPIKMIDKWGRNVAGKQHPTFSPMGPFMVTADEVADPHSLELTTKVNGKTVQSVGTDDLIFTVAQYIAYISHWYHLQPGDIISTGTPGGVGVAKKPPEFLQPGDEIEVSVSKVGTLVNRIGQK